MGDDHRKSDREVALIMTAVFEEAFAEKRVAVTGHTGFTGGWLCAWLNNIGADVFGLALAPGTTPNLHELLNSEKTVDSTIGDICDMDTVKAFLERSQPDILIHLAAQPIVSIGYDDPYGTFNTNVMGTLNVLEAARNTKSVKGAVCITTDKVYENKEWAWGYRESDPLGGKDPYSASKSACEMVIHTYQNALAPRANGMLISSARGGNIIGGGDWADNRIVPDFARAASTNGKLELRNPNATRPWQHVLALIHGYLMLGARLLEGDASIATAWNFGPTDNGEREVGDLVKTLRKHWPSIKLSFGEGSFNESRFLHLTSERARKELDWNPPLNFEETVKWTAEWYRSYYDDAERARSLTQSQLSDYRSRLLDMSTGSM